MGGTMITYTLKPIEVIENMVDVVFTRNGYYNPKNTRTLAYKTYDMWDGDKFEMIEELTNHYRLKNLSSKQEFSITKEFVETYMQEVT